MTKADVLDSLEELKLCIAYEVDGTIQRRVPFQMSRVNIEPQYHEVEGWNTDITSIKNYYDLPVKMTKYIEFINTHLEVPVKYISNGPGSDQLIVAL